MTLPSYAVDFRGHPACPCLATWLPAYEHELQRRGLLVGPLRIYQLIGDYAGSGNTHSEGGAFDLLDLPGDEEVWVARQMGADATWTRPKNWDGKGGIAHDHGVLTGCPHNGPARYQIDEVRAGGDGLLGNAPDTGPRPLSGRTWQQGIEWAQQQEDEMTQYADQLNAIQQTVTRTEQKVDRQLDRALAQTTRLRKRLDRAIEIGKATRADLEAMRAELDDDES